MPVGRSPGTDDGAPSADAASADASPSSLSGECVPLCGAVKAYGRFVQPWHHARECPAYTPPPFETGRCSECKAISRCGFLCKECGKRVIPFPPKPKPSGQSNWIPFRYGA